MAKARLGQYKFLEGDGRTFCNPTNNIDAHSTHLRLLFVRVRTSFKSNKKFYLYVLLSLPVITYYFLFDWLSWFTDSDHRRIKNKASNLRVLEEETKWNQVGNTTVRNMVTQNKFHNSFKEATQTNAKIMTSIGLRWNFDVFT